MAGKIRIEECLRHCDLALALGLKVDQRLRVVEYQRVLPSSIVARPPDAFPE